MFLCDLNNDNIIVNYTEKKDEGMSGSCIDREHEAKAMLKIAGREIYSEGYRDDPMTDHEK